MKRVLSLIALISLTFYASAQKDYFTDFKKSDLKVELSAYQKSGGFMGTGSISKQINVLNEDKIMLSNFKRAGLSLLVQKGLLTFSESNGNFEEVKAVKTKVGYGDKKKESYHNCFQIKETPVLLTRVVNNKTSISYYLNVLKPNTYLTKSSTKVFDHVIDKEVKRGIFWGSVRFNIGDFGYVKSENDDFFAVYMVDSDALDYKIYDAEGELVDEGKHEFEDIEDGNQFSIDLKLANNGDLIFAQSNVKHVLVTRIGKNGYETDLEVDLESQENISEIEILIKDGVLNVTGIINQLKGKRGQDYANVGVFNISVSAKGDLLGEFNKHMFTKDMIVESLSSREKKRMSKGKNVRDYLADYEISDVIVNEKGERYVFLEYFDYYVTTTMTSNGTTTTPHYVGGNILAFKFDTRNDIVWGKMIKKYTNHTSPHYRSFQSLYNTSTDEVHLIFNDYGKFYPGEHQTYKGPARMLNSVLTDYVLNSDGTGERTALIKSIEGRSKFKMKKYNLAVAKSKYFDDNPNKFVIPMLGKKMAYLKVSL